MCFRLLVISCCLIGPLCAQLVSLADIDGEVILTKREHYKANIAKLETERKALARRYNAATIQQKKKVMQDARMVLEKQLFESIFPAWYKTPWDFNGITQVPGKGKIACGYFVTTCVRDLGFKIHRVKLAQQASGKIIKQLCEKESIKVIYNKPIGDVAKYLEKLGEGVYIVGLDQHVGFVVYHQKKMLFVHADYYQREIGVTAESIDGKNPLADSKYRMIGKLFHDEMMENWLQGKQYAKP